MLMRVTDKGVATNVHYLTIFVTTSPPHFTLVPEMVTARL